MCQKLLDNSCFTRIIWFILPLFSALILWQAIAMGISITKEIVFPTPCMVFFKFVSFISGAPLLEHSLFDHTKDSLVRWITGYMIAISLGLLTGFFSTLSKFSNRIIIPQVHVIQMIPGLAWIPVALLIFGVGQKATIFMVSITAFTPVVISTAAGIKGVDETYIRAAKMLGATQVTLFFKVLLPGSMPHILSGLRIGMANGWRVLVAGEMVVGSGTGLGYAIIQSRWTLDYTSSFVCMGTICVLGLFFEKIIFRRIESYTIEKWSLIKNE